MIDLVEIYTHWDAGRSQAQIAQSLGVDRKTVRKYLAPVAAAGMRPGDPVRGEARWRELAGQWFPQLADARLRQVSWPRIAAHRDYVYDQMTAGVTVATIHQRLVDERGLDASVASLRRWVRANLPEQAAASRVRVLRPTPAEPGAEAQIDYGRLGMWSDPLTGRRRTVWAFVMVLACSRHMFVRPVLVMDQAAWTQCHLVAFEFFSGVVARLVPDNLKTGVDRPDLYDPKLNRSYGEMAAHYGTLIDPARASKPRDKPRVERPMPYVRDSFWRGRDFTNLETMRAEAVRWCVEVAGQRDCRALDGAAPARVFAAVEAPALRPLPTREFVLATWSVAKVSPDIHVRVAKTLYSVPWRLIGQQVQARSTATMVQILHDGDVVATHVRKHGGKVTNFDHYPPEKIAFHMRTPTWCRRTAEAVGPACVQLVGDLLALNALYRLRSAQGVLGLADKHTPQRLEAACAKAIAVGDPSYRTVKGILVAGTETETLPGADHEAGGGAGGSIAAQAGAFLRGPDQLFDYPPTGQATADPVADPVADTVADTVADPVASQVRA